MDMVKIIKNIKTIKTLLTCSTLLTEKRERLIAHTQEFIIDIESDLDKNEGCVEL